MEQKLTIKTETVRKADKEILIIRLIGWLLLPHNEKTTACLTKHLTQTISQGYKLIAIDFSKISSMDKNAWLVTIPELITQLRPKGGKAVAFALSECAKLHYSSLDHEMKTQMPVYETEGEAIESFLLT